MFENPLPLWFNLGHLGLANVQYQRNKQHLSNAQWTSFGDGITILFNPFLKNFC